MLPSEKLRLCYALRAAGDARPLADLAAQVEADLSALEPPAPTGKAVVGVQLVKRPDGSETKIEVMADGTEKETVMKAAPVREGAG